MGGVSNEILPATEGTVMGSCSAATFGVVTKHRLGEVITGALAIDDRPGLPGSAIDDHVYLELKGDPE